MKAWNKIFFCLLIGCLSIINGCSQTPKCSYNGESRLDYLPAIQCMSDFEVLQSKPLSQNYGNVKSVKLIYDIENKKVYFINSKTYTYHFDFCSQYLKAYDDLASFNKIEYSATSLRNYVLANLNYYVASDLYTVELFADDACPSDKALSMFLSVSKSTFLGEKLRLLNSTAETQRIIDAAKGQIVAVSVDEIYGKQTYQPMIASGSYGYLRMVDKTAFDSFPFQIHDIIVTDFLPNDFPYCQGIITAAFQTPLCHVNILSHNRNTPNCAYKYAMKDQTIQQFVNQLVYFEVGDDTFILRKATIQQVQNYWNQKEHKPTKNLACNTSVKSLLEIKDINMNSVSIVGGKAANFGELDKIKLSDNSKIMMPEGAFAIPFYFYKEHIVANHIQVLIDHLLSSVEIKNDRILLAQHLKIIQDSIKHCALDPAFLNLVENKMRSNGAWTDYRFRSSTNAEDVPGFNGAGLYESKTGSLTNPKKTVEEAIKKVWASLWDIRAFEEREAAGINQHSIAMGILVHRAFGDEEANGVAITKDLYRKGYPAFTVNVQKGETSVVLPEDSSVCDQFMIKFSSAFNEKNEMAIEYISHSSINHFQPVMTTKEIEQLAMYLQAIKRHFYYRLNKEWSGIEYEDFAMDVEFKLDKVSRQLYIKQARTY